MTAHLHSAIVDGCYRCELGKDEVRGWVESLVVTSSGVVHDPDCTYLAEHHGRRSRNISWLAEQRFTTDRACTRCLLGDLPEVVR